MRLAVLYVVPGRGRRIGNLVRPGAKATGGYATAGDRKGVMQAKERCARGCARRYTHSIRSPGAVAFVCDGCADKEAALGRDGVVVTELALRREST